MKILFFFSTIIIISLLIGCDDRFYHPDVTPPSTPQGLYALAGDKFVDIDWNKNPELDLMGYRIYVSTAAYGKYQYIGSTKQTYFIDEGISNGVTYYYKVIAYDFDGNESSFSHEIVSATPRPEGYDVILKDYWTSPDEAGYDFSNRTVGPYDDQYTDVFYEYYRGSFYMYVNEDTEIQDLGYTKSLYEIIEAPSAGWSPSKDVRLILGHTYVIKTWDHHYAKLRIIALYSDRVIFDWVYQLQPNNRMMKIDQNIAR